MLKTNNESDLRFKRIESQCEDQINIGLDIGGSLCKVAIAINKKAFDTLKELINQNYGDKYIDDFISTLIIVTLVESQGN